MSAQDAPHVLLTPREAAALLRISTRRLHELRRAGAIPAVKVGAKTFRFRRRALLAALGLYEGEGDPGVKDNS